MKQHNSINEPTKNRAKKIVELYSVHHFSVSKIQKIMNASRMTIINCLWQDGIDTPCWELKATLEARRNWKSMYEDKKLSLRDIAKTTGASIETIRLGLKKDGVPLRKRGRNPKKLDIDQLITLYEDNTIREIAAIQGTSIKNISTALKNNGVVVRKKNAKNKRVNQQLINTWVELYKSHSTKQIAKEYGFSPGDN
jgi:transposase